MQCSCLIWCWLYQLFWRWFLPQAHFGTSPPKTCTTTTDDQLRPGGGWFLITSRQPQTRISKKKLPGYHGAVCHGRNRWGGGQARPSLLPQLCTGIGLYFDKPRVPRPPQHINEWLGTRGYKCLICSKSFAEIEHEGMGGKPVYGCICICVSVGISGI